MGTSSNPRIYEVRPRKDHRGVDLVSDVLPFGRLSYGELSAISNAIFYAKFRSRSHNAVIRVYDEAGNVIETHEHAIRDSRLFLADAKSALTIFTDSSLVFSTS
jgi:hypothetical protein